jgi:glycosyltransferase involved in cell wall biosynthesis
MNSGLREQFELAVLDTADRRGLTNIGRFDWGNVSLAIQHGISFLWWLLSRRPDIIYVGISQNVLGYLRDCLFLVPSRLLGCRVVIHLHGSDFRSFYLRSPALLRILIQWTLGSVRRAVVLDASLREIFSGLVPENRIVVVPNGISPMPQVANEAGSSADRSDSYCRVVYLGTLMKAKGFMQVLHSIPLVLKKEPQVRFILAGEHCYREEIQEARDFISQNGLDSFVSMPGIVIGKEKARLLNEADVFVFPPVAPEGQPLVILEAMSASLPVITTDQGAISETVLDGVNGFIVPAENPAILAEKVLLLVGDPALRQKMGSASRERFLEHYTLDRWVNDMSRMFQDVREENI